MLAGSSKEQYHQPLMQDLNQGQDRQHGTERRVLATPSCPPTCVTRIALRLRSAYALRCKSSERQDRELALGWISPRIHREKKLSKNAKTYPIAHARAFALPAP